MCTQLRLVSGTEEAPHPHPAAVSWDNYFSMQSGQEEPLSASPSHLECQEVPKAGEWKQQAEIYRQEPQNLRMELDLVGGDPEW